ncbi:Asp-tRNA(Asn)/Glu-tRNA(Gln) amidotransferase subunit GatA [Candidatus Saccharibacteria bacterium]|jgi:aspartyl-tRNA(Asn)/glutamyl-tRNA(Gln) amidotransferase subunit A|nr:Asp-tRNA(Asn)/Glu-tRNA(Gln) amidotransferase subunit GatA [Candidatus Saccharibacteria bacterium]
MTSRILSYLNRSAKENVQQAILKAKQAESYHALLSLTEERALEQATKVDAGEITGRLAGVPFVAKDNILTFGGKTTAASKMLEDFTSPLQATVIEKLEAEGAICIGKANLDAFAHGGSTENSAFGPTKNAKDPMRVAGGSSGGSAVAVALDIVPFALGTDTGGSIRQPASFNGVVGFKPTYGMVSRYGVVAMGSSTDVIGPITNSIADSELVLEVIQGADPKDMTTLPSYFKPISSAKPGKIGLIKEHMSDNIDPSVLAQTRIAVEQLEKAGYSVEEVSLPMIEHALAMYYIIVPAEVSSNLARYDGVRYGHRSDNAQDLAALYGMTRSEGFEDENKRRIMIGAYVLSSGFFDAYYLQAQKARTLLIDQFRTVFEKYDALIGPVSPTPAFRLNENTKDPIKMYLTDTLTVPANLVGCPAISIPFGSTPEGLPIGVQLMTWREQDAKLLALARELEGKA